MKTEKECYEDGILPYDENGDVITLMDLIIHSDSTLMTYAEYKSLI